MQRPGWFWAAIAVAANVLIIGILYVAVLRGPVIVTDLLPRLPHGDRMLISLDVSALREGGILDAAAGVAEEAEYKSFVAGTGFDYHRDLDQLLLAVGKGETYAWVIGRFDWSRLAAYAEKQGGKCQSGICRMDSPTPGRKIAMRKNGRSSFAFVSSPNPDAIQRMFDKPVTLPPPAAPKQPVWFLLPHALLQDAGSLPTGSRMFISSISGADHAFLSLGVKGGAFEMALDAQCNNEEQARQAVQELKAATTVLNRMLRREKQQPNARDLSGVLTRGEFEQQGLHVKGQWPVERVFLESLNLGGAGK